MAYLGEEIGKLGFGFMRLPKNDNVIDLEQTKKMVDAYMAAGFTYFDTAWAYDGSEDALRQALVERYPRESFQIATKNACWISSKTKEEAESQFYNSLKQIGVDYIDFYLLHNVGQHRTHFFDDYDLWNFIKKKKEEGLIRHIGFSFHSTPEELDHILTLHPEAEFVQLQINYADWDSLQIRSRELYETARKHGKPVIIMEPVKGGMLANPPEVVQGIFKEAEPDSSFASWGIRFAAGLEGIITVLSGMSSLEQLEDNLKTMKGFTGLSEAEKATLDKAQKKLAEVPLVQCTSCNYCAKVCPQNVGISGVFNVLNVLTLYGDAQAREQMYWRVDTENKERATACIRCGACEEVCPQHLPIRELLAKAADYFGPRQ